MKLSQKIINAILFALLSIFGYNEYDPILPTAQEETEGIDHDKIEIANVYAVQAWPRNPEQ